MPEPLGYDDQFEYVGFIVGDAGADAGQHHLDLNGVRSAGALLRRCHNATIDWEPPADGIWSVPFRPGTVICHGDPQPANFAWRNSRATGLFDWDAARPGDPLSDLAYALLWFIPINADPDEFERTSLDRRARAEALLDGYGWTQPIDIVEAAVTRHALAIDEVVWLGQQGHQPHAGWVAGGWPQRWRDRLDDMRRLGRRELGL